MSATMAILAGGTAIVFCLALLALYRRPEGVRAAALLALGSGLATVWSTMGIALAEAGRSSVPSLTYLSLALMGLVTTLYFGQRARARARR